MEVERLPAKAATAVEWMMLPHTEVPDLDERHRDIVAVAVDQLDPRQRMVIEAFFFERLSYSKIGRRLGVSKTHAWRITQRAIRQLQTILINNQHIRTRYQLEDQ